MERTRLLAYGLIAWTWAILFYALAVAGGALLIADIKVFDFCVVSAVLSGLGAAWMIVFTDGMDDD